MSRTEKSKEIVEQAVGALEAETVTTEEAARILGVSRQQVNDMVWREYLSTVGLGRQARYLRSDVEQLAAKRRRRVRMVDMDKPEATTEGEGR